MNLEKPFRHYIKKHRRAFILGIAALFFTNLFDGLSPLILKKAIDDIVADKPVTQLIPTLLIFFILIALTALFRYAWRIYFGQYHHSAADDLRNRIFSKFTELGPSFYEKRPVGQLMSLITNDVGTFRMGIGPALLLVFDSIFIFVTILPIMIYLSPDWTWKSLLFLPVLPFIVVKLEGAIQRRFRAKQDKFSEVSGISQEIVSGVRVIKSYGQEDCQTEHFNKISKQMEHVSNRVSYVEGLLDPVMHSGIMIGVVALFIVGGKDVITGTATLGTFVAFFRYIQKLSWPMTEIGYGISMILEGRASFERISEVLRQEPEIKDLGRATPLEVDSVEIKNLSFKYPGSPTTALNNISFSIQRGETVGIFGPIGSGKTTLVNLLCRVYNPSEGAIFLNGHPLPNIQLSVLRNLICLVPQNVFLFGDTIRSNLALGVSEIPEQDYLEQFTRLVKIHDDIVSTREGYDTLLGERGVNLSGGQKQRLSIGRGLIRNCPIVVLDDVLSAVDADTEKHILSNLQENLFKDRKNKTTIIISHRIVSMEKCDKIIVLNRGRILGVGRHADLLKNCSFYQKIHDLQVAGAENSPSPSSHLGVSKTEVKP